MSLFFVRIKIKCLFLEPNLPHALQLNSLTYKCGTTFKNFSIFNPPHNNGCHDNHAFTDKFKILYICRTLILSLFFHRDALPTILFFVHLILSRDFVCSRSIDMNTFSLFQITINLTFIINIHY